MALRSVTHATFVIKKAFMAARSRLFAAGLHRMADA